MNLLTVGEGMRHYLCIAQVALGGSYTKMFYMYMNVYVYYMHDIMVLI